MKIIQKYFLTLIVFILTLSCEMTSQAQENQPKSNKNAFALDVVPIGYDIFGYEKQLRVGVDYSRQFNPHWFVSGAIDMGLYNEYAYKKYFDFFNEYSGFYYIQEDVHIVGFHLMPSANYFVLQSKVKQGQGIYAGAILDLNYYKKNVDVFNSSTLESSSENVNQFRTGAGLSVGGKMYVGQHFFGEFKTSMFGKIYLHKSNNDMNEIKSLNSQWSSENNNFWLVFQIKLGYAF